ncbi:hypothetical protein Q1695_014525 [Nippostrongylus brasiliensis]|nr:hypothetical protein Q1695_014525 [Nippostrongylus brasiliensis]
MLKQAKTFKHTHDGKSSICKGKTASPNMTDSVRQKFLKLHNHYRSLVARGKAYDKILGRNVPTASKMQKLKYTCRLEETAWKYAQKCTFRLLFFLH